MALNGYRVTDSFWEDAVLHNTVKKFIDILDRTEESEEGTVFKPVQVSCCRAHLITKLDNLLGIMRELTRDD